MGDRSPGGYLFNRLPGMEYAVSAFRDPRTWLVVSMLLLYAVVIGGCARCGVKCGNPPLWATDGPYGQSRTLPHGHDN